MPEGSGIYFLVRDGQVVYVGSSAHPSRRCYGHERCAGKEFDYVVFLAADEAERESVERHWIRTLCPAHNKAHNPRPDPNSPGWGASVSAKWGPRTYRLLPDLDEQFAAYAATTPLDLNAVIGFAVRDFLIDKGWLPGPKPKSI